MSASDELAQAVRRVIDNYPGLWAEGNAGFRAENELASALMRYEQRERPSDAEALHQPAELGTVLGILANIRDEAEQYDYSSVQADYIREQAERAIALLNPRSA